MSRKKKPSGPDKRALLGRVSLLKGISRPTLDRIFGHTRSQSYRKGDSIFTKDSSGECLYVLVRGRVKIYSALAGKSKTFAMLDGGDFFGEMALLGQPQRSASAQALQDSELLILERRDFQKFLKADPALTLSVLRVISDRLRKADQEIEMLSFQNVLGRTALTLTDLMARYGRPKDGCTVIDTDISQQELADLIGTAREMVSRVLARFRRMGAIDFDERSGRINIISQEKLKNCISS